MKRFLSFTLTITLLVLPLTGCFGLGNDKAKKKAFYTAEVVYGIDTMGDLFELFNKGGVVNEDGYKKAIKIFDDGLIVTDEVGKLLKDGLPVNNFEKARTVVSSVRSAVASGLIKFNTPKAESAYANTLATIEVTINLIEAINAGDKQEVKRLETEQKVSAAKARASVAQADPTWYQQAIVRGSQLVSELVLLANSETAAIWEALEARSTQTHAENFARLK